MGFWSGPSRPFYLVGGFLALTMIGHAQCFDLSSTHLYNSENRFHESWDKPIWNSNPGDGNFHVDDSGFGRALQFAIFSARVIRTTPEGWMPFRAKRRPEMWIDLAPERSGPLYYMAEYESPPPTALIRTKNDEDLETWSLSKAGILRYARRARGAARVIENRSSAIIDPRDFGFALEEDDIGTLDLNTGIYCYEHHTFCNGCYARRINNGVKLSRTITFQAAATLQPVPCPASQTNASLKISDAQEPPEIEMKTPGVCAIAVKEYRETGFDVVPVVWEFVQNPSRASGPDGCVWMFKTDKPPNSEERYSARSSENKR